MNNDIVKFSKELKKNINELIQQNKIEEATELLIQYERIARDDIDIFNIKAIILMIKGDMVNAIEVLEEGMLNDSTNIDLLYNIAYAYRIVGDSNKSALYYRKLLKLTDDKSMQNEVSSILLEMDYQTNNRVLIGSPVYQKPEILEEFLKSLKELNKGDLIVDYFFIDDNENSESTLLLEKFKEDHEGVLILKSECSDRYVCDENTHSWKENLVWKVANFKDIIIKYAKDNYYDYLFFIDSDLVLHKDTLSHLILTGKDIISEVFWTKWTRNAYFAPQVWLSDTYTQFERKRDESLDYLEISRRKKHFIDKLREPGVYEVGGLGACTLISSHALHKGVSFKEIDNLSFWGEDRHFCIRAKSLGLKLYVDTHYPAYHIYRDEYLSGISRYKNEGPNVKKKRIALVYTNFSGSNTLALYKLADKRMTDKYDILLVKGDGSDLYVNTVLESDVVVITEGNFLLKQKLQDSTPIVIDLWHGFPMKAMGYADKGELFREQLKDIWNNTNYITSYSTLFNDLMNRCIDVEPSRYVITGAQRNDFLFYADGIKNLNIIFNEEFSNKRIVLFMPTYRNTQRGDRTEGNKSRDNIFGFDEFDKNKFEVYLEENNIIFFIKLHPAEEKEYINKLHDSKNIRIISDEKLISNGIDLYEVLNAVDVIITDYSSVYFDTLLIDTPCVFTPVDYKEYNRDRGFLLEPYDKWTPGPTCLTQDSLQEKIQEAIEYPNNYKKDRKAIANVIHKYADMNSSMRTWEFIDGLID